MLISGRFRDVGRDLVCLIDALLQIWRWSNSTHNPTLVDRWPAGATAWDRAWANGDRWRPGRCYLETQEPKCADLRICTRQKI